MQPFGCQEREDILTSYQTAAGPKEAGGGQLTRRERGILFSPFRLVVVLAVGCFVIETLVMQLIEVMLRPPPLAETLLDATILTIVLFAILMGYVFRPLMHLINDYRNNENELIGYQEQLEEKVAARTHELDAAVNHLEQEISERRKVEEALRESEERFRQIFEQSEDAIVMFSPADGKILDVNPMSERIFGQVKDVLIGEGADILCADDCGAMLCRTISEIANGEAVGGIDALGARIPGRGERVFSFRGKLMQLGQGEVVFTTFRDVTRRVQVEKEAKEIQARLIHANRMTSLGMLVTSVAHEINNPNNFILMNARLVRHAWDELQPVLHALAEGKEDISTCKARYAEIEQQLPEQIDAIIEGGRRINDFVDNLKDFGRDEQGRPEGAVDINAVVRMSVSILNHHIARHTRHFSVDLPEGLPKVRGRVQQLEQVVLNLVMNALQALPDPDRSVRVSTSTDRERGEVTVRVADMGGGFPPEVGAHIMEPFFTTRLDQGGTGLGLAISAAIVKDYGGSIEFCSEPGSGTVFTVHLRQALDTDRGRSPSEVHHDHR